MASHLALEERAVIAHIHRAGKMQTQIAERLGRSGSTISRELRRNRSRHGYGAVAADRKAQRRRSERPWVATMQRPDVQHYVQERLRQRWSPDEIAGRSRKDFPYDRRQQILPPTIYAWIGAEEARRKHGQRSLRRLGKKRPEWEKRGRLPASVSIEGRPAVVDRIADDWLPAKRERERG
jgi:transposase, IS30 family